MRKFVLAGLMSGAAVLALPASAFAAQSAHQKKTHDVTYVLTGQLSGYTAATSSSTGSITVAVSHSNFENKALKGQSLTFTLGSKTRVIRHARKDIADGDKGVVKVRAPKGSDSTTLQGDTPFQVIDKGAAHSKSTHQQKTHNVMYVLTGTLSGYTAATSSSAGSVTIAVTHSNFENKTLKGQTLTFTLSPKSRIVLHDHKAIADGDKGVVKVRDTKGADTTSLQAATPFEVIDKGAARK